MFKFQTLFRQIIATDRDRIDVELEPYIVEEDIIMDLNRS
jgi:hypothetical protein